MAVPRTLALVLVVVLVGSARSEGLANRSAREMARECELRDDASAAAEACRSALSLGLAPARARSVRQLLARRLVVLGAWGELAQHYAEDAEAAPEDAVVRNRLGNLLHLSLARPGEALPYLEEAVRLRPESAAYRIDLGLALSSSGKNDEALAAFDKAVLLDEAAFALRPAATALRDALRAGRGWP